MRVSTPLLGIFMNSFFKGLLLVIPAIALSAFFLFGLSEGSRIRDISWIVADTAAILVVAIACLSALLTLVSITLAGFKLILGIKIKIPKSRIDNDSLN